MTLAKHVVNAAAGEMKTDLPMPPEDSSLAHVNSQVGLQELEDTLFKRAFEVTTGAMAYADMPWDWQEPSQEWIDDLGKEAAWRKFRLIKAGQLPTSHAPAGLKVATAITMAHMNTRAVQRGPQLAVNVVVLTEQPEKKYPEQIVDVDE
ncbi:MAG: hypothetical protein V3W41_12955 [Planctomycetota bacterium]